VALVALGYVALPLWRDRATRFLALGTLASVLPLGGTFPSDRYLLWAGIGTMGIVAQLTGLFFGVTGERMTGLRRFIATGYLVMHGILSPLVFPLRTLAPSLAEDEYEFMADSIPRGPGFAQKTVVVLNAPVDLLGMFLPFVAKARGEALPAHMYILYAGPDEVTLSRSGPDALELRSGKGWLAREMDRALRGNPMRAGDAVHLEAMNAEVQSVTADGRPDAVRFQFPTNLDDPSLLFLVWGVHGFEAIPPPAAGAGATLAPAPLLAPEVLKPHLRLHLVEPSP
jgi:hypothetical protein